MISFNEAFELVFSQIKALEPELENILNASGRVVAENLISAVDSPSVDVSLKDGYAVCSSDVEKASPENQIALKLVGEVAAGGQWKGELETGQAVRILSGAPIPDGADAVLAEEFSFRKGVEITAINDAGPGRNILPRGSDVEKGSLLLPSGTTLIPPTIGLLAAAGFQQIPVYRRPRVGILACGDEVIAPGQPLLEGKLYASNLVTIAAWCQKHGYETETSVVKDDGKTIKQSIIDLMMKNDALLTNGGAWSGERDLVVKILNELGWKKIFHRVRMGPGKAVGFGILENKPVFCLPGGPPSNHMAFLQLALPGLALMAGSSNPGLPLQSVLLAGTIAGQADWTQFVHGTIIEKSDHAEFYPIHQISRLQMLSNTDGIAMIPEGQTELKIDSIIPVQRLTI